MKKWLFLIMAALIAGPLAAGEKNWAHRSREPIERRLALDKPGEQVTLEVDNVIGSIIVTASAVNDIGLSAIRQARAATPADLQLAGREVKLDVTQKDNCVRLYVDGPFREKGDRGPASDRHYYVRYDFILTVPRHTAVRLKNVTDGDIRVSGVEGSFRVDNVNGAVVMSGIAGNGQATTVNGALRAGFSRAPAQACEFHTVNGDIELAFPDGLNADIRLKTVNGEAWSDFDFTTLAANPPMTERRDGRTRIATDHFRNVRLGRGGPTVTMETVNGDMTIARHRNETKKSGE